MLIMNARSPRDGQRQGDWLDQWSNALTSHTPFTASNMSGSNEFTPTLGRLPAEWRTTYLVTADHAEPFAVFSYDTPIAWHAIDGTWWVPAHAYGSMTRQHRARVMETLIYSDRDGILKIRTTPAA